MFYSDRGKGVFHSDGGHRLFFSLKAAFSEDFLGLHLVAGPFWQCGVGAVVLHSLDSTDFRGNVRFSF